jgi:sec-independent protein translocase protein TatA
MLSGGVKPWHIIVLVVVLILLFGAKRLPDAARGLGRSLRIIKAETAGLRDDDVNAKAEPKSGREPLAPEIPDDQASPLYNPVQPGQRSRDN